MSYEPACGDFADHKPHALGSPRFCNGCHDYGAPPSRLPAEVAHSVGCWAQQPTNGYVCRRDPACNPPSRPSGSSASSVSPSLRDRIAATIHDAGVEFDDGMDNYEAGGSYETQRSAFIAVAVVALLGLTEQRDYEATIPQPLPSVRSARLVGPWLPVNPDSTETT